MLLSLFHGRFLLMRVLLLGAALLLVCVGILTIYAIGHPANEVTIENEELRNTGTNNHPGLGL